MRIPIFLSYPKPYNQSQSMFIDKIAKYLYDRGFKARTLGVTDYDMEEPLTAIRRLMLESNGILTIAFKRLRIEKGVKNPNSDIGAEEIICNDMWITSPYCHIEPAMAFQIGLPILIFREKGVLADGILEKGVTGTYLPEFDLENDIDNYFENIEWNNLMGKWEGHVRKVVENKGKPPKLY